MVLVLLSLMGGMIVAAVQGVTQTARESRTKSIIAACDAVIQEHYESYKYRPLPVEIPDLFRPGARTGSEVGFDALATEAARVRLMMIRDLQRMELPDRLSDIVSTTGDPSVLRAAINPVVESSGAIVATRDDNSQRRMAPVRWYGGGNDDVPAKLAAYRDRIPAFLPSPPAATGTPFDPTGANELTNQGAECLFMIMSTSFVGGTPAIDAIPPQNIGDTDEDGLLEILDGWGQPLVFIRWPVGYHAPNQDLDTAVKDDFDLFRSDYAYVAPTNTSKSLATDVNYDASNPLPGHLTLKTTPWSIRPLILSVGSDGIAGIATNPFNSSGVELDSFSYRASAWNWELTSPVSVADEYYGAEALGRDRRISSGTYSDHPFPDPYLRVFVDDNTPSMGNFDGLLPGQQLDIAAAMDRADNITNYQLQASQ